ncbi:lachesin isoform X2 [Hermetia illucens]|uniref:lachesin isoform X2 n=1 Tax=Hermetia illucens TaxID=343691 RepID=UPI0018CC284C|nr:lachesin isoform X2 [Hermetia illucens]
MWNILRTAGWILASVAVATLASPEIATKGKQLRVLEPTPSADGNYDAGMPRFAEPIPNVTVSVGRDALLACVVENLKAYKVAWVRVDTQTILSIHHNVITQNPRISLSYNDHRSWYLHIREVEEADRGWYMCQVNTDPMRSRKGYLQVVVPPMINETMTSNDMVVREGTNVTLVCKARGYPEPYVMWRREDGEEMVIGKETVNVVDGEILHITKVSRLHMAAYLCVASNGVPPSISKRVHLRVQFPPMLSIPNQLEGAYIGQDVTLECHTEAYPASINYWTTERGDMIISDTSRPGDKFQTTSTTNGYSKYMKLKIHNVSASDFGSYRCVAKNSLGETDGVIKLDEILAPTTAIMSEITMYNRSLGGKRPHRKMESNALPDYGVEEWKDSGDTNQPSVRHPPGAFHNKASSGRENVIVTIARWITFSPMLSSFAGSSEPIADITLIGTSAAASKDPNETSYSVYNNNKNKDKGNFSIFLLENFIQSTMKMCSAAQFHFVVFFIVNFISINFLRRIFLPLRIKR